MTSDITGDITGLCREHSFEPATDICRLCGAEFCDMCLLYPSGKPLCKGCAMAAGGVRSGGSVKPLSTWTVRKRVKMFEAARADKLIAADAPSISPEPGPVSTPGRISGFDDGMDEAYDLEPSPGLLARAAALLSRTTTDADDLEPDSSDDSPASGIAPHIDWNKPFG